MMAEPQAVVDCCDGTVLRSTIRAYFASTLRAKSPLIAAGRYVPVRRQTDGT